MRLSAQIAQIDANLDLSEKADLLRQIDAEIDMLRTARAALASDIDMSLRPDGDDEAAFPLGNNVVRFVPKSPTWIWHNRDILSRLSSHLADTCFVDRSTGEVFPPHEAARRVIDVMAKATGAGTESFSGWRSTALQSLGIEARDVRERKRTDFNIKIEPLIIPDKQESNDDVLDW